MIPKTCRDVFIVHRKGQMLLIYTAILLLGSDVFLTRADLAEDRQALLDFIGIVHHSRSIKWDKSASVCRNWIGVSCDRDESRVTALRLPGVGLRGPIPPNTLARLSALRILSLRSNAISGSFPPDFSELQNLTSIYLQSNNFSGPVPYDFSVWKNLSVVDLSSNHFNGSIPDSISNLTHLIALNLSNNLLSGSVPDLNVPSLQEIDLANNSLTGTVPESLRRFPSWAFSGNDFSPDIAFPPTFPLQPPTSQPSMKSKRLSESAILGIVLGGFVSIFAIAALLMICYSSKKAEGFPTKKQKTEPSLKKKKEGATESQDKDNRLVFFEGYNFAFDLEDLLRASAEVLGKGMFGTTYKAALEDSTTVAVKRLKEVTVPKREFEQQMELVGSIRDVNVASLRAYYYSKDEKLTVYDYYEQSSVSSILHGKTGDGGARLDWNTRLRIAVGAARGIAHVHTKNGGKLVHGNIKSSNIFLNSERYGCVSDIGLATLMNPIPPHAMRASGYRAPELTDSRKATQASDVYSYGVVVLELLTGKSPTHATGRDEAIHLVRWVNSVVREEWTAEVFDVELLKHPNIEEEMVEMLQIGMSCVQRMPEQRPKMADVVRMVEGVRRDGGANPPPADDNMEFGTTTKAGGASTSSAPQ